MNAAQADPWRQQQRAVLTALRIESGKNRSQIAHDAGLEYWQLVRLETGKSELPAKLIPTLAHAYGKLADEVIERLGLNKLPLTATENLRGQLSEANVPDDEIRDATSEARTLGPNAHLEANAIAAIVTEHHERTNQPEKRHATR